MQEIDSGVRLFVKILGVAEPPYRTTGYAQNFP